MPQTESGDTFVTGLLWTIVVILFIVFVGMLINSMTKWHNVSGNTEKSTMSMRKSLNE